MNNPYDILLRRHVTEKAKVLENLHLRQSNPSLKKCKNPRYVFEVHPKAGKREIASAFQEIYKDKNVHVVSVNTVNLHAKPRRVRGHAGMTSRLKKAIVTLRVGESIDEGN